MHIEARLFEFLTAFFVLAAVVYAVLTAMFANGGVEWAGTTALVMTAGLTLITGTFFRFVARRLDTRPEDYEDAEISDGAGELGFYSPHSWWPLFVALAQKPLLVIRGEISELLSADTFERMKEAAPDMQFATVPGIGHAPELTEPEAASAIEAFLANLKQAG